MKSLYFTFTGVPCCEHSSPLELDRLLANTRSLVKATSLIQADCLIVLGGLSRKQVPLLAHVWQQVAYPSQCLHIAGCGRAIESYFISKTLKGVIQGAKVLNTCQPTLQEIQNALQATP